MLRIDKKRKENGLICSFAGIEKVSVYACCCKTPARFECLAGTWHQRKGFYGVVYSMCILSVFGV